MNPRSIFSFLFALVATTELINAYGINCIFENYSYWGTHYTCRVSSFDAFCKDRNITAVSGTHTGQNTNDQVGQLYMRSLHSECVPQLLPGFFKNLQVLILRNTITSELYGDDLAGLTMLISLDLRDNRIETVPANFFDHTPSIERISLNNNKIKYFFPRIFPQLTQLRFVNILSNVCIDVDAETSRSLRDLHALLKIQCKPEALSITNIHNSIENICTNATCTNIIYSYGDGREGNDSIIETRYAGDL